MQFLMCLHCVVKYRINSSKAVVGLDRHMKTLSMYIHKPYSGKIVKRLIAVFLSKPFVFKTKRLHGAQWLIGRVLDQRPRSNGLEPHQRHCVVSLSKTYLSLLSTGSIQEDPCRYS